MGVGWGGSAVLEELRGCVWRRIGLVRPPGLHGNFIVWWWGWVSGNKLRGCLKQGGGGVKGVTGVLACVCERKAIELKLKNAHHAPVFQQMF